MPRFAAVGAVGFAVDGGILSLLAHIAGWAPWSARFVSFPIAVVTTWLLNRKLTFRRASSYSAPTEGVLYGLVQFCGAAINLAVFGACMALAPALNSLPIVPFAIGSGVALFFNFAVLSSLLYARARSMPGPV